MFPRQSVSTLQDASRMSDGEKGIMTWKWTWSTTWCALRPLFCEAREKEDMRREDQLGNLEVGSRSVRKSGPGGCCCSVEKVRSCVSEQLGERNTGGKTN